MFSEARSVRLAGVAPGGQPVLRTLDGVVCDGWLQFHGSPKGEKASLMGTRVVAQVEERVASVPSHFIDPERACPATTLFRSAQAHGVLEATDDPAKKAGVLAALMRARQPEGGYVPIAAEHPLYRSNVRGALVFGLRLGDVTGKAKLGQNRTPDERRRMLGGLWRRGEPGDARAIELVRAACPDTPLPAPFEAPPGATLHGWIDPAGAGEAARLLSGEYWNDLYTEDELGAAHAGSQAWVGAKDSGGRLVGTARAVSDGAKYAWIGDVCVASAWRGRGLGTALVRLVLDHPAVRRARRVHLGTRDAQALYAKLGFVPRAALPPRPYTTTEMVLVRR